MNTEQVKLVQDSLVRVRPMADQIASSFYAHLFEIAPYVKKLFRNDMERQGEMLMTSLELAMGSLDDLENILPAVQALGDRHVSYGVKAEYYKPAVEAFLWALEQHLGDDFSPALNEAWSLGFDTLVKAMTSVNEGKPDN